MASPFRRCSWMLTALILAIFLGSERRAQGQLTYTCGDPGANGYQPGTDHFTVSLGGFTDSISFFVHGNWTNADKASALAAAINADTVLNRGGLATYVQGNNYVTLPSGSTIDLTTNASMEHDMAVDKKPVPAGGTTGMIDYEGNPSGVTRDAVPMVSSFSATIGFTSLAYGSITTQSSISYSQLSTPTAATLLEDTFVQLDAGLPSPLQSSLILDMPDGEILFNYPTDTTVASIANFSSDSATSQTMGLGSPAVVPEPASMMMLGVGLMGILVLARQQRRAG